MLTIQYIRSPNQYELMKPIYHQTQYNSFKFSYVYSNSSLEKPSFLVNFVNMLVQFPRPYPVEHDENKIDLTHCYCTHKSSL